MTEFIDWDPEFAGMTEHEKNKPPLRGEGVWTKALKIIIT
jgi:hypothetical protein